MSDADPTADAGAAPPPKRSKKDRCPGTVAVNGCRRTRDDHKTPFCEWCGRPHEHHRRGEEAAEVEGRRRMAAARITAGVPVDAGDERALALPGDDPDTTRLQRIEGLRP